MRKVFRGTIGALACLVTLAVGGCRHRPVGEGATVTAEGVSDASVPFVVRADSTDVLFFWFDDRGGAHAAGRVSEVPVERRQVVRVDPPRPELRVPGMVYLANLQTPAPDGTYPLRAVRAEQLSAEISQRMGIGTPGTPPEAPSEHTVGDGGPAVATASQVIIYGASWCGACHQAAAYLRQRHIAFVEKDIEREPGAAAEMMAKAQRAGVPTGSIPIIDVRGHLLRGFSAQAIEQALAGG